MINFTACAIAFMFGMFIMRAIYAWDDYDYEQEIYHAGYDDGHKDGYRKGYDDGRYEKFRRV